MDAVMISCAQRRDTERPRTLAQLSAVGIETMVTESSCDPAGGPLNRYATWTALKAVGDDCLFLEDDIDVNPDTFLDFLDMAKRSGKVTTFTCFRKSLHPPGTLDSSDLTPKLVRLVNTKERRGFYGTQAIYLPAWAVQKVKDSWQQFVKSDFTPLDECHGFDFWIKNNIDEILMAFPNPVEHRAPPKMKNITRGEPAGNVSGTMHRSLSYHLGVTK